MYTIGNQVIPSHWEPKCSLLVQIVCDYIHRNHTIAVGSSYYIYDGNLVY
jgi:hypothetical protein